MQSQEAGASCLSNANALLKVLTTQENNYPWSPGHLSLSRDTCDPCSLSCDATLYYIFSEKNQDTWNSGKRDPEAADVTNVHRGLHQTLDGVQGRGWLRGVVQPLARTGRLQLAGAQRVKVAVGGHEGAGGGRQAHQHHHRGPGHAAQPRGAEGHHRHHWGVTASLVRVQSISLSLTLQLERLMPLPTISLFHLIQRILPLFSSSSLSSNFLSVWI